ncbi:hypothetical protein [Sphingomonas sp. RS2018]
MVRLAECCAGAVFAFAAPGILTAQTVQTGMTVSGGVTAETNPYNEAGTSGVSVAATAELRPRLRYRTESTTIDLAGSAQFRQFLRRYGLEDNYGATSDIISRISENATLRARAGYGYNQGGFGGFGRPTLSAGDPLVNTPDFVLPDVPFIPTDVTILGQRTRVSSFDANTGIDYRLSQRTQVSIDAGARTMRFGGPFLSDFNSLSTQARVNRVLDERTSVGVIGSFAKSDFLRTRIGDSETVSALLALDTRVAARWTISASAGIARTSLQQGVGQPDISFSSLTTNIQACSQGEFSRFCLNAQRSPQPAANGDVRISDTIGADYSYRLSPGSQISVGGNYARTGRGRVVAANLQPPLDFAGAFARYDRRLTENMTFFTSANYSKIFGSTQPRRANAGIAVGIQLGLGALK